MLKKSWKNWIAERYTKVKAEEHYEKEKETAIALLEKQKEELELSLSHYNLENAIVDYEGITKLFFEGNYVHATTKGEQYTVRLKDYDEMFAFLKKLKINNSYNTLIGQEKWIITTKIRPGVDKSTIPQLDFMRMDDHDEVRIFLDLTKEIDLVSVKGIIDALHGEFNVSMNYDRINEALISLVELLNHWLQASFTLKFDATDVRKFTFFAENDEGDTTNLLSLGSFDVEKLLLNKEEFTSELKRKLHPFRSSIENTLNARKKERLKQEAMKQANEILRELEPLLVQVKLIYDEVLPSISFQTLSEPIVIQANAETHYFDFIKNINQMKLLLESERSEIKQFVGSLQIKESTEMPFSLEEGYLNASISKENMVHLLQEANEKCVELSKMRLQSWMEQEHPSVQEVIKRFSLVTKESTSPYSFVDGTLNVFITPKEYEVFTKAIRVGVMQLLQIELSEEYKELPTGFDTSLFGVSFTEREIDSFVGSLQLVEIQKSNGLFYKKYFKNEKLLPVQLINKLEEQ